MKINKPLYYILNLTWGLPLTLVGLLVAFILICCGKKPHRHGGCIYFNIGKRWGGLELGLVFLIDERNSYHTRCHEYGHSIQNAMFGPFMVFIVSIPSAIRYWWFIWREYRKKPTPDYDAIWFEGTATRWGTKTISQWSKSEDASKNS